MHEPCITRYAITNIDYRGLRILTFTNWACYHYDTREAAEEAMRLKEPQLRAKVLGDRADTLAVLEVLCWHHGESVRSVFEP